MRKRKLYTLICLAMAALAAGTMSCRKDPLPAEFNTPAVRPLRSDDEAAVEKKILAFRERCACIKEHPGMKSAGNIGIDDAVWFTEASLNYTFGCTDSLTGRISRDSSVFALPRSSLDSLGMNGVALTYYGMIDSMQRFFSSIAAANKKILVLDVQEVFPAGKSTGAVYLKVTTTLGYDGGGTVPATFGPTDFWYYGGGMGKCGGYPGGYGSDAAQEITRRVNRTYPVPAQGYFTDIETVCVDFGQYPNPDQTIPNYFSHFLFFNDPSLPNYHECLSPLPPFDEMNYYLEKVRFLIGDLKPDGKVFKVCCLSAFQIIYPAFICHGLQIQYGIFHTMQYT